MYRKIEYTRIERSKRDSPIFVDTKIGTVPARRPWAGKARWFLAALLAAATAGVIVQTAAAQAPGANVQTPAAQAPPPQRPGNIEVMLVKNALTAVNQGNITGFLGERRESILSRLYRRFMARAECQASLLPLPG